MSETSTWSRRRFLKGVGTAICLPFFPSLHPGAAWADEVKPPTRLMFMCVPLGFVPNKWLGDPSPVFTGSAEGWFPSDDGPGYTLPPVHAALAPHREHISFLKGLCNHNYRGEAHYGDDVFLTTADTFADASRAFSNSVSCDQVAAASKALGGAGVRHPSLALGISPTLGTHTGGLSWSEGGIPVSPIRSPAAAFDHLFGKDALPAAERLLRMKQRRSLLDAVTGQIDDLERALNDADRRKLDESLTAVRGVEAGIQREELWVDKPKPAVALARPAPDADKVASTSHAQAMFAIAHAAFLTDSTRVITYEMPDVFSDVVHRPKHGLNHNTTLEGHADAVKQDAEVSNQVAGLIAMLCGTKESDGKPLIHHTVAALGSGVWGQNHYLRSLPLMLIGHGGGRIAQGTTRAYDPKTPLANLWLSMMKAAGVEVDRFGDSTGTLDGVMQ